MDLAIGSHASAAWLARFVNEVRVLVPVAGRALEVERLPDGKTTLVVRVMSARGQVDVSVAGPRTRPLYKVAPAVAQALIVEFKAGWAAQLVGVPATALTDRIIPLGDLWGRPAGDLCVELAAARDLPEMLERISEAVALRVQHTIEPAAARLARRAARLLEAHQPVAVLADRLGVTARHLRRTFTESVGIGPKEFARILRLQRAMQMASCSNDWGRIATDAGYYDQAHLIAEFRKLVGQTPGALVKRSLDRARAASKACESTA